MKSHRAVYSQSMSRIQAYRTTSYYYRSYYYSRSVAVSMTCQNMSMFIDDHGGNLMLVTSNHLYRRRACAINCSWRNNVMLTRWPSCDKIKVRVLTSVGRLNYLLITLNKRLSTFGHRHNLPHQQNFLVIPATLLCYPLSHR